MRTGRGQRDGTRTPAVWPDAERSAALVRRMAEGDSAALVALYEDEGPSLFAYVSRFTADRALAEEVVQGTFLAAWREAAGFAGRAGVRSWLFAIARRRAIDALRRPALRTVPEDAAGLSELPTHEPGPEDKAISMADRAKLAAALNRLSPVHREVLELIFTHGLSYAELSEVLGIPLGTAKSRLNYGKRLLRALLSEDTDASISTDGEDDTEP